MSKQTKSESESNNQEIEDDKAGFIKIPEDWSVEKVKKVANSGKDAFTDGDWVESEDMDENGEIQLIQLRHIGEGRFKGKPNRFVNREFVEEENCTVLDEGELMISRMQEPILRACLLPGFEKESIMAVDIARLKPKESWNSYFLNFLFNSRPVWKQGLAWASGTTRKRISRSNLGKVELQKPPLSEQEKIASVLYNVDRTIQKTEEIIEQTKRVKKGLRQNILTKGINHNEFKKVRLGPEETKIPESWSKKPISECCEIRDNERIPLNSKEREEKKPGDIPYYGANDVVDYIDEYIFDGEFVLLAEDGGHFEEYQNRPVAYKISGKAWVNNHAHILEATDPVTTDWLFYSLEHRNLVPYVAGSTRSKLTRGSLKKVELLVPPKEEQQKITEILSNIDEKINSETQYKEILKNFKRGMMQDLLTSEVRTKNKSIEVLPKVKTHG